MKIRNLERRIVIVAMACLLSLPMVSQVPLFPTPVEVRKAEGYFMVGRNLQIGSNGGYAALLAGKLGEELKEVSADTRASGEVFLELNELAGLPDEGYTMEVTPAKVVLKASSAAGLFYAKETFLQLAETAGGKSDVAGLKMLRGIPGEALCSTKAVISLVRRRSSSILT